MFGVFCLGFAYGFCAGLLLWCGEMMNKEWRRAYQPAVA